MYCNTPIYLIFANWLHDQHFRVELQNRERLTYQNITQKLNRIILFDCQVRSCWAFKPFCSVGQFQAFGQYNCLEWDTKALISPFYNFMDEGYKAFLLLPILSLIFLIFGISIIFLTLMQGTLIEWNKGMTLKRYMISFCYIKVDTSHFRDLIDSENV